MLGYCPTCHDVMSSTALDFHRSQHDPLGRPFKCNHGCIMHYFATFDDRQHHLLLMHGIVDDHDGKPEIPDTKPLVPAVGNRSSSSTTHSSTTSSLMDAKSSSRRYSSRSMTCTICQRIINLSNMHFHMRSHDKTGRSFECVRGCRTTYFKTEDALQSHNYKVHTLSSKSVSMPRENKHVVANNVAEETVSCTVCGRIMTKAHMTQHMRLHVFEGRPFACESGCPSTYFRTLSDLKAHIRVVHKIFSSNCIVCNKTIVGRTEVHMRLHDSTGRPFQCLAGCVQTFFKSRKALKDHARELHVVKEKTDNDLTSCTVCGTQLLNRNMKLHMVMHENEKKMVDNEDTVVIQTQLLDPTVTPEFAITVPTAADQQSETNGINSLTSPVNRPVVKKKSKTKVSAGRRSVIGTPTVQMQMKMEPSTMLSQQSRREDRMPSPPVYDQLDNQAKPSSFSATDVDGVAQHTGSLKTPSMITAKRLYFDPAKRSRFSKVDHPDQGGSEVPSDDQNSDILSTFSPSKESCNSPNRKRRRQSYQRATARITQQAGAKSWKELDDEFDAVMERLFRDENQRLSEMTAPRPHVTKSTRQAETDNDDSDSDSSVIVTAVEKNTNWLPSLPTNTVSEVRSKLHVQNVKIEPVDDKSQSKLTTFFKIK